MPFLVDPQCLLLDEYASGINASKKVQKITQLVNMLHEDNKFNGPVSLICSRLTMKMKDKMFDFCIIALLLI